MPQSLSKVIIHIIFSTKDREPWLDRDVRPRMHAYVATICRDLNAEALRVGGVADHLHIVTTLPRTLSQAATVETLKKTSSKWIKGLNSNYRRFYWQRGYGAFSVSPVSLMPFSNTWRVRKHTIAPVVFKRSIATFCANTASNSTNAMSGIEVNATLDSRFQRSFWGNNFPWGVAPGLNEQRLWR
jgi:putative transposase